MLRQSIVRGVRPFSSSVRVLADGDIAKGGVQGDSFSKREQVEETKYVREQELSKLKALKEKLAAQKKNVEDLMDHIDDMAAQNNKK